MPSKRKRDILEGFDPNLSASSDDDFDPTETSPSRPKKKTRQPDKNRSQSQRKSKYRGSDIEEDEEQSDSADGGGFKEYSEEDEEDEDAPLNATGRRARKSALNNRVSYRESSEDEEEEVIEDSDAPGDDPSQPKRHIVTLKDPRASLRNRKGNQDAAASSTRRSTRARTEDLEEPLYELSNSGKHGQVAQTGKKSETPEPVTRSSRATRGAKGLKKPPSAILEATQETEQNTDPMEVEKDDDDEILKPEQDAQDDEGDVLGEAAPEQENEADAADVEKPSVEDEEDDDDIPVRRSTRMRNSISGPVAENGDEPVVNGGTRRLTRKSHDKKKSTQEPSSDFNPDENSADENVSDSDAPRKAGAGASANGDDTSSSAPTRGRRQTKSKRSQKPDSGDEEELDKDEMAEELVELRASSNSRPRRRRRERSNSIIFEEPATRRRTKPVDYSIKPLDPAAFEVEEEEEPAATPARGRRGGRHGAAMAWERNLNTTFGPFGGGGGGGSLLGGPWGTGATGGVDSDSSDDERVQRPGASGGVGMTPISAAPAVGLLALPGQLKDPDAGGAAPNVGKVKNQKAFADADPLGVDMSVDFSKVGGLQGHIDQLKEMVQLPLLYPEFFQKFHVTPPRGVLFHGPPGTGKTLLARALANSIGSGGRKVTFYMRKGADALSKWVGEAEKQLRLLFEEARKTQPSIIFFDEIDGLAPVRSSKQEQIHASIVSTLLALMDGMDGRGQVIVIGATNRPDNIDPALRRPGRFDREFYFPLPDKEGRRAILDIHTRDWGLSNQFMEALADRTKGFGGADLRAICTEAALNSIQRTYPQIYGSKERLVVDPDKISIHSTDFMIAVKKMIPSSERSASSAATPLPKSIEPLLRSQFRSVLKLLNDVLPHKKKLTALEEAMYEQYQDSDFGFSREEMNQEFERARVFRPRLLITGLPGMGQSYLSAAILHHLEGVHVQNFDLANLLGDGRPLEQVIVGFFTEVKRHKPSVIYIPNVDSWWASLGDAALVTFETMLKSIPPTDPVLLLATAEKVPRDLDPGLLRNLFGYSKKNRAVIARPNRETRLEYFTNIITNLRKSPTDFPDPANRKKRVLEDLPVAPPPPPKTLTKDEVKEQRRADLHALNILKVRLQPIMDQINRKYRKFRQPVIPFTTIAHLFAEADPNFVRPDVAGEIRPFEIARDKEGCDGIVETATGKFFYNLEITTIEERLANGYYARPMDFYKDINRLVLDARNIGDHEREHKAKELRTNVYVDVHEIDAALTAQGFRFDEIHQRQLQRTKEAAERARKRTALQSVVDMVQSDLAADEDNESQGPVGFDPPIQLAARTTDARFRVMSPLQTGPTGTNSHPLSNGTSGLGGKDSEDIHMGGLDDETQPMSGTSQMGPPAWPSKSSFQQPGDSTGANAGTTQISQTSALTQLPAGVSPSAILNDASTTKTSDPSTGRGSSNFSTQRTNGFHIQDDHSQLPDTQPGSGQVGQSQSASSDNQWPHSQADALKKGLIQFPGSGSGQTSPTSSQIPPRKSNAPATSLGNILNDVPSDPASIRNSGSSTTSSQQPVINERQIAEFHQTLADQTSGCTIEQLEQINRELMEEIWHTRGEWNRVTVLGTLTAVFNDTIRDIESLQGLHHSSQELSQDNVGEPCVRLG